MDFKFLFVSIRFNYLQSPEPSTPPIDWILPRIHLRDLRCWQHIELDPPSNCPHMHTFLSNSIYEVWTRVVIQYEVKNFFKEIFISFEIYSITLSKTSGWTKNFFIYGWLEGKNTSTDRTFYWYSWCHINSKLNFFIIFT